jgi:hypothetical protein
MVRVGPDTQLAQHVGIDRGSDRVSGGRGDLGGYVGRIERDLE